MAEANDDLQRARSMLEAWALGSSGARRDLDRAVITDLRAVGPMQVVLRSDVEVRGVRHLVRPGSAGSVESAPPDPWAAPLSMPEGSPPGSEISCAIAGERVMSCLVCSRQGRIHCEECSGSGEIRRDTGGHRYVRRCERCAGRGEKTCDTCAGSGIVYAASIAWARMEQVELVRVIETERDALPLEAFLALQETTHGGDVVHRQREPQITELRMGQGGYRGSATHGPLAEAVSRMLASPGVPDGARIRAQELEVRRVPAFALKVDGQAICLYGELPRVHPANALRSKSYYAVRVIPIVLTALAAIAALVMAR